MSIRPLMLLACCLVLARPAPAAEAPPVAPAPAGVWVCLTLDRRGDPGNPYPEYRGLVAVDTYRQLVAGTLGDGFVEVQHLFWLEDDDALRRLQDHGHGLGANNRFRAASILEVTPLTADYIERVVRPLVLAAPAPRTDAHALPPDQL